MCSSLHGLADLGRRAFQAEGIAGVSSKPGGQIEKTGQRSSKGPDSLGPRKD